MVLYEVVLVLTTPQSWVVSRMYESSVWLEREMSGSKSKNQRKMLPISRIRNWGNGGERPISASCMTIKTSLLPLDLPVGDAPSLSLFTLTIATAISDSSSYLQHSYRFH